MIRKTAKYGWIPDLPDPRDHVYSPSLGILQALPDKVDLQPKFPMYDQGRIGSCTANAIAGAIEFDRIKSGQNPPFIPSRLFIYYNERSMEGDTGYDRGAQIRDGIKSVQQQGVCPETEWPYDDTPAPFEGGPFPVGSRPATQPSQKCYDDGTNYIITSYQALNQTLSQLQGCLAAGFPFVFGFSVFSSWDVYPPPTIIPIPSQNDALVSGHAVLCVGYDNSTQLFKIRNSWGDTLGDGGYFYMPYAYTTDTNLSDSFWVINAVKE
ncbi:MAG: C1 family peptidase [Acidobacteriaceae bacterium]